MSNFSFLAPVSPKAAENAEKAEHHVYDDPDTCLTNLRKFIECLVNAVVEESSITVLPSKERGAKPTLFDKLQALKQSAIVPKNTIDQLHDIRRLANRAVHEDDEPETQAPDKLTVQDSTFALRQAYRIAVWFAREYKQAQVPIPEFVMPEKLQSEPEGATRNGRRSPLLGPLDSPRSRWIATILGALGLMWLWRWIVKGDSPEIALNNVMRIVLVVAVLVLLVWPIMVIGNGMTIWGGYKYILNSLSESLGWDQRLIKVVALGAVLPLLYAIKLLFAPLSANRRRIGAGLLLAMVIGYNLTLYSDSRDMKEKNPSTEAWFYPDGTARLWFEKSLNGHWSFYSKPGHSPETGRLLAPVSQAVYAAWKVEVKPVFAMEEVDPKTSPWFDSNGAPLLWYRLSFGGWHFFNRSGHDPKTGELLLPVSEEVRARWNKMPPAHDPILRDLNAGVGRGEPGLLLLGLNGSERDGVDLLEAQLPGMNTTAIRAAAIQRDGFGSRIYEGDAKLLQKAISYTGLGSLLVADVTVRCEKRNPIDPDILSCDLTANAREFDRRGSQTGQVVARGTGPGRNRFAALQIAAQRASKDLIALAKH